MNATQNTSPRDIVRRHTAFRSFEELKEKMAAGYLPTVHRKRQAELLRLLQVNGLPAFEIG